MLNANELVGNVDVLLITLDTLRYDVAQKLWQAGRIPHLARYIPSGGWELRHSPGSFTYAAHQAFFAGFLPTPSSPGLHPRLFALRFLGSETTTPQTCVFDAPDIITGFAQKGYHTICVGGVGFFNQQTPLGCVLPKLFHESHWERKLGVTEPRSTEYQVDLILNRLAQIPESQRVFCFLNVSALHQPNCHYLPGAHEDSLETHAAALEYVDQQLARLWQTLPQRGPWMAIVCSDHGTAYGDDGYTGHRLAHPVVWNVPYTEFLLNRLS